WASWAAGLVPGHGDPCTDVSGAVLEPDAVRLAALEKAHDFGMHERHVPQVEDDLAMHHLLLVDQALQLRDVRRLDAPADREARALAIGGPLDFQHGGRPADRTPARLCVSFSHRP